MLSEKEKRNASVSRRARAEIHNRIHTLTGKVEMEKEKLAAGEDYLGLRTYRRQVAALKNCFIQQPIG